MSDTTTTPLFMRLYCGGDEHDRKKLMGIKYELDPDGFFDFEMGIPGRPASPSG